MATDNKKVDEVETSDSTFVPADLLHEGKAISKFQAKPGLYVAGPAASVIFDDDGFFATSNETQIKFLNQLIEEGHKIKLLSAEEVSAKEPEVPVGTPVVETPELDALKAKANEYKLPYDENVTAEDLAKSIAEYEAANPKAAGVPGMTTTNKK